MALLDNGAQINTIMHKYVSDHSLQMGLITNLLGAKVTCLGLGNAYIRPLGYVIIWVQVDGFQGYDEDQIALVIPDLSNFVVQIPVILGTPTISQVINVMKEAEIDALTMPWANARVTHLWSVGRMMTVEVGDSIMEESNPDGYEQIMFTQHVETIEPFSSHVVLVKVGRAYTGECINIMVQALQTEDGSLPRASPYKTPSGKKNLVARAVAVLPVPKPPKEVQLQEGVTSPRVPIPPDWLLGKDMANYSMNWIWVGWTLEPPNWQMLPADSWPNTMMCSHWIQGNWAVPTLQNTQ